MQSSSIGSATTSAFSPLACEIGTRHAWPVSLSSSQSVLPRKVGCFRRSTPLCRGVCSRRWQQPTMAFLWGSDRRNRRPKSKNVLDTTMAWGDILTLMATELASERIPLSVCGLHCTVTILAWVGVAVAKGDYRYRAPSTVFGAQQTAMILASFSGAVTWALFVPTVLASYASMVTHNILDPAVLVSHATDTQLPAQLEVIFASLWSVASWRGIYAGLRPYI
ncbi:g2744 [Coccomyxa elongata]